MKNSIDKFTIWLTVATIVILFFISIVFNVTYDWFFLEINSFENHKKWFPSFYTESYIFLKILPITLIVLSILFNIYSLWVNKLELIKKYNSNVLYANILSVFIFVVLLINATHYNGMASYKYGIIVMSSVGVLFFINYFNIHISDGVYIVFFMLLTFVLRWWFFINSSALDIGEDSLARVSYVYFWEHYGGFPGSTSWPFMPVVLTYFTSKLFCVPFEEGGRILNLFLSVLLIPISYYLFKKMFNKTTAVFSLFVFSINPFFIRFSTIQMTEIMFLFFMVLGIYFTFLFFEKKKIFYGFISVLSFNIASVIRFEAWIIIPLLAIVLFFQYGDIGKATIWFMFSILGALMFSFYSFIETGNPISGVSSSDTMNIQILKEESVLNIILSLIRTTWFPLPFLILTAIGFLYSYRVGRNKLFILFISIIATVSFYKMITHSLMPFWRYYMFILFVSIPFMFYFLHKKGSNVFIFSLLLLLYIPTVMVDMESIYVNQQPVKEGFLKSAYFVLQNMQNAKNKFILSINPGNDDDMWLIKAGLYEDYPVFHRLHIGSPQNQFNERFTIKNISKNIIEREYNIILIENGYEIDSVFNSPNIIEYLENKKIESYMFGEYTLIEIR